MVINKLLILIRVVHRSINDHFSKRVLKLRLLNDDLTRSIKPQKWDSFMFWTNGLFLTFIILSGFCMAFTKWPETARFQSKLVRLTVQLFDFIQLHSTFVQRPGPVLENFWSNKFWIKINVFPLVIWAIWYGRSSFDMKDDRLVTK